MKVKYDKLNEFKIFGLKIFEIKTQYIERSIDKEDENDEFYIDLTHRALWG